MRICQSPSAGQLRISGGVLCSLPRQNGQGSTCLGVSRGASSSAFFGRMLRAVATSTDSLGTTGLMRISRTSFVSGVVGSDMRLLLWLPSLNQPDHAVGSLFFIPPLRLFIL